MGTACWRLLADVADRTTLPAVPADQAASFGPVASDSTCWHLLDRLTQLDWARARATAQEIALAQRAELSGLPFRLT